MQFDIKRLFSKKEKKRTIIIVGLGNPGDKYQNTYHNMGYKVLDELASRYDVKIKRAECSSLTAAFNNDSMRIVLAKPITYMNLSGQAVKSLAIKHNADISDIIIVYDDIDLSRFTIRARQNGSAGSHNGMKNIVAVMGSSEIKRIRIGVGKEEGDLKNYVLSNINKADEKNFKQCFEKTAAAISNYITENDFEKLMRDLNSTKKETNEL